MAKMYNEESKYGGDGDSFEFKLMIFHDISSRSDLPQEAKAKALPTMLRGPALDFYYTHSTMATSPFSIPCQEIQSYFKGPEYKRGILTKWNNTSLKSVVAQNQSKSLSDCLQLLLTKL